MVRQILSCKAAFALLGVVTSRVVREFRQTWLARELDAATPLAAEQTSETVSSARGNSAHRLLTQQSWKTDTRSATGPHDLLVFQTFGCPLEVRVN